MIAPEGYGEIIGGSERVHDYELMKQRIKEHNLDESAYEWYLDLSKYGAVPHSGFGLGLERTVAWISGVEHVRETIPFPRLIEQIIPLIPIIKERSSDMQHEERLRIWIEQGNVNISQLFFHNYKSLGIKDLDAMLIMHMTAYKSEGKSFSDSQRVYKPNGFNRK